MCDNVAPVTDEERESWPKTPIVNLPSAFEDDRGSIQPLVDVDMKSCVLIFSRAGSVRANHYHKTDWHYCYVLSGSLAYFHRPTGSDEEPEKLLVKAGQTVFTPPMVDHAMVYLEDTTFLALGRNSRKQDVYESDVVRIPPIES